MINLKARETRTLVAVHGWAGAVLGLLLYAVIVAAWRPRGLTDSWCYLRALR